jgi:hypothetical protein
MIESFLLSAADSAVTQTSVQQDLGLQTNYGVQAVFSSITSAGTLTLEGSLDNVSYGTIEGTTKTVTAGGVHIYNVSNGSYRYTRLKWVPSAGTGTITVKVIVKQPSNHF